MSLWFNKQEEQTPESSKSFSKILSLSKNKSSNVVQTKTEDSLDRKGKNKSNETEMADCSAHGPSSPEGQMDLDDEESFLEAIAAEEEKLKETDNTNNNPFLDKETSRFETLSVNETPTKKRKRAGEDVFTKEVVKTWQASRIKAWEARRSNPEAYYFRLVVPGCGQRNGVWSSTEHQLFMERYNEWISKGWKIGTAWGLFSIAIPHRVGYQCMNYYRKLVLDKRLEDSSYTVVDGKLKHVQKERGMSGTPTVDDSAEWEDEEVKEIEKNVNQWIKEFHNRIQPLVKSRPIAKPKVKAVSQRTNISDLVKKMPPRKPKTGDEDDFQEETTDPEVAHLEQRDWEAEWNNRLNEYKEFLKLYQDEEKRHASWLAKQEWRRGLLTTEMLMRKNMMQKSSTLPPMKANNSKAVQSTLSRFFTGVKKKKVDTPDELISFVRIPNDLYSGVKQIQQLTHRSTPDTSKLNYFEVENMNDCIPMLDQLTEAQGNLEDISSLEGILVDPPWEFYVADGRNDGACCWNISRFQGLMEDVVKHMTAGLVFVWTHKLIQADLVRMMYTIDCKYVENLVWFKKSVNNVHLDNPSPYISSTKEILLMFKKGEGFELRHQRSPDVIIDFEIPTEQWIDDEYTEPKPPGVYEMIETLLPKAGYNEVLKRGRFLELWAKKTLPKREGWIAFHQKKNTKHMLVDEP